MEDYFSPSERKTKCVCGKICFDKKTAVSKKHWLEKRGREKELRVYQCNEDDSNWHLTKTSLNNKMYDTKTE